jgi:hypothetical protein
LLIIVADNHFSVLICSAVEINTYMRLIYLCAIINTYAITYLLFSANLQRFLAITYYINTHVIRDTPTC